MAHKKGEGSSKNGRDSHAQRLGIKIFGGQAAIPGSIIVRQRGTKSWPGKGVDMGKDHTIFSKIKGIVEFRRKSGDRNYISVVPAEEPSAN